MPVQYQTDAATSGNQLDQEATLAQILAALQAYFGATTEAGEISVLQQILAAFTPIATSAKQDTGNTTLASILAAVATAAKQDTGNTSLASILASQATATLQSAGNASLTSIDAKLTKASTATTTQANQTASSQVLLAANPNRKGFMLYNNTGQKCYIAFGPTATTSAFAILLAANSGYEPTSPTMYTGQISAIFGAAGGGNMQVTELT